LLHPFVILVFTAISSYIYAHYPEFVESEGGWLNNPGFHGLSEQLYEYTSSAANNGSGFEGLGDNTYFWNWTCGIVLILTTFSCNGQAKKTEQETTNKQQKTMGTIHLTKEEFLKKVVNYEANPTEWKYLGDKPAIIDFYASWCGPCKMIAPVLEELAAEYDGKIYIYKIDTEAEQELAAAFNIRSIPSILFVPMVGQPQMAQGAMPKASFKEAIESVLLVK
jgi:thioredoxin